MLEALRTAAGGDCVLDAQAAQRYALRDAAPVAVVAPRRVEEAAAVMQLAAREGWTVVCAGAGTRLGAVSTRRPPDIVLTTIRMNALTDYEPADLVLTAQAGVSLAQLGAATARHKQFLALDPPVERAATIGGVVATAAAGPLRFAHGTPRDHVLGVSVIAGDARSLHFGGKVVKNVAGYDVVRPLVGSHGTLALLTEVSVRLKPLPEADQTALVSTDSFSAASELADALASAQLGLVALEIVSPAITRELGALDGWTVLTRFHGNSDSVRDALDRLRASAARFALQLPNDAAAWQTLGALEAAAPWQVRLAQLPSLLPETAAAALHVAQRATFGEPRIAMQAGDGIARVLAKDVTPEFEEVIAAQRAVLEPHGGTVSIARAARTVKVAAFGAISGHALMSGVKRVFDPAGILAPGSFVV